MDSIKFVPQSQKTLEQLGNLKSKDRSNNLIYVLITFFVIYIVVVGSVYWFFVVQEQNKVTQAIQDLDSVNNKYYISDNLEQSLFNLYDLIIKSYDPTAVIKEIESAYISGITVSSFSYIKGDKLINISMLAPSINDVTSQIDKFNKLNSVAQSSYSAVNSDNNGSGFSFVVEIILK